MGLDMYLYKKTYLSTGDFIKEEFREEITLTKGGKPHPKIKKENVKYVVEEVGYWRKANHIHKWFVDNVQEGDDDCAEYEVSRDQLMSLLKTCNEVVDDYRDTGGTKAHELLPTSTGFFFGDTSYDQHYFGTIFETIEIIEDLLEEDIDGNLYYESSW